VGDPGEAFEELILANLPVGLWVARAPSGESVYVNSAFNQILGMGGVAGLDIGEAPATYGIHDRQGNLYPVEKLPFSRALHEGKPVVVDDLVIHRQDGRRVAVRAFATPVRDGGGRISLVIVAFIDISAEAAAIAHRNVAEERLAFAIEHAPVMIFTLDRAGTVTFAAGAGLQGVGFTSTDLVGRTAYELYPGNPEVEGNITRVLAGETIATSFRLGDAILESFLTPIRADAGEVIGITGVSTDVTEQRRLQAQAIQSDRVMAMGTLAASVAHEINNPLTYILGSVDEVERLLSRSERRHEGPDGTVTMLRSELGNLRERLSEIRTGADRVRHVARDLRSFARPDDETVSAVELGAVVRAVLELVRKDVEARARLVLELQDTPAVRANEARLVQVILNLLVNAWQALGPGDPARHEIGLRTFSDGRRALIEVWDSGPGVPLAQRSRIFDPFFSTKEIGEGTGLGLFVCRNIVTAFGGSISVHDHRGGGALFRVTLPAATGGVVRRLTPPVGLSPPAARPVAGAPAPAAKVLPRPQILIVDDDEWVARTLAQSLAPEFEATVVQDGEQAVALIANPPGFDLVYCDLMMRGLTGMDLYDRLASQAPAELSRLVFMTGGAFTPRAARFVEEREDVVVHKPFDVGAETRRRLQGKSPRSS
jgi:two-component system, cell cycle sensor histidine kinase and response regulator CckA